MTFARSRSALLLAFLLVLGACSGDDDGVVDGGAEETTTTEAAPTDEETTTTEAASEEETTTTEAETASVAPDVDRAAITITEVSFTDSTVTIRNDGAEAVDLTGYFICNRPAYAGLPDGSLDAGATQTIDVAELDIRGSGGEFGLYRSNDFGSADDMVAYVQWGAAGNGRASVAVEAGLITEGDFVANDGEDFSIS